MVADWRGVKKCNYFHRVYSFLIRFYRRFNWMHSNVRENHFGFILMRNLHLNIVHFGRRFALINSRAVLWNNQRWIRPKSGFTTSHSSEDRLMWLRHYFWFGFNLRNGGYAKKSTVTVHSFAFSAEQKLLKGVAGWDGRICSWAICIRNCGTFWIVENCFCQNFSPLDGHVTSLDPFLSRNLN